MHTNPCVSTVTFYCRVVAAVVVIVSAIRWQWTVALFT